MNHYEIMVDIPVFQPNTYEILLYVESNDGCLKSEIYKHIGFSGQTSVNIVNDLIESGLLSESKSGRYNKKSISLTEKGLKILSLMKYIADTFSEDP